MKKKILFHICCGPCATASVQKLQSERYEVTGFYYNPNIYPKTEYKKRLKEARKLAEIDNLQFIVPKYLPLDYRRAIKGREAKGEGRCRRCWEIRLQQTAELAKELGFQTFGTSLRISPYQNQTELLSLAEEIAARYGLRFYDAELTSLYRDSVVMSKELGMYRQKYCGCRYSRNEV